MADDAQVSFGDGHVRLPGVGERGEGEDDVGVQQVHDGRVVGVQDREDRDVLGAGQFAQDLAGGREMLAGQRQARVAGALQAVDDDERQIPGHRDGLGDGFGGQVAAVIDEQRRVPKALDDFLFVRGEGAGLETGVVAAGFRGDDAAGDVRAVGTRCRVQDPVVEGERGVPGRCQADQASADLRRAATRTRRPGCSPPVAASRPARPKDRPGPSRR